MQSLEHWKKATKLELKLDLEQKLLELEHKHDIKFLEHKKELASFRDDSILEDRINNLEAKVDAEFKEMRTQMQVTSVMLLYFT